MGKIFCLMGKSSTGKDTIYKMLRDEKALQLQTIVPYTTRPIRAGETEGVEYHFIDEQRLLKLEKEGKVIEQRAYDTIYGIWRYATNCRRAGQSVGAQLSSDWHPCPCIHSFVPIMEKTQSYRYI